MLPSIIVKNVNLIKFGLVNKNDDLFLVIIVNEIFSEKLIFAKAIDSINHFQKKPVPPVIKIDLFAIILSSGRQLSEIKFKSSTIL